MNYFSYQQQSIFDNPTQICTFIAKFFEYGLVMYIGATIGLIVSLAIVIVFALIIVNGYLNLYYAFIFFILGWAYLWKMLKKNRIQLSLDNDYTPRMTNIPTETPNPNTQNNESSTGGSKGSFDGIEQPLKQ